MKEIMEVKRNDTAIYLIYVRGTGGHVLGTHTNFIVFSINEDRLTYYCNETVSITNEYNDNEKFLYLSNVVDNISHSSDILNTIILSRLKSYDIFALFELSEDERNSILMEII